MKIKVCGISMIDQLQQLQELGVDYAGIIFYSKSKRFGGNKLKSHLDVLKGIPIKKVGVFVNEDKAEVRNRVKEFELHAVQLHGEESPEYCTQLATGILVIKAFGISNDTNVEEMVRPYENSCHYYLFDTRTEGYGGSGKQFNWDILMDLPIDKPFYLSGGISPEDVNKIQSLNHPFLHALDINSRFEIEPGIKNMEAVESFVNKLRNK